MDSLFILLSCLLVGGLLTWRMLTGSSHEMRHERRASSSTAPMSGRAADADADEYKAVSIRICPRPCTAALDMRSQPFLENEAPALPLPGCDRACRCSYQSQPDRRSAADRRYPAHHYVKVAGAVAVEEQRDGRDRRRKGRFQYNGIY